MNIPPKVIQKTNGGINVIITKVQETQSWRKAQDSRTL